MLYLKPHHLNSSPVWKSNKMVSAREFQVHSISLVTVTARLKNYEAEGKVGALKRIAKLRQQTQKFTHLW